MPTGEIISAHYDWDVELSGWWEGAKKNNKKKEHYPAF